MAELYIARNAYVPDTRTSLSSAVITLTPSNFVYDGNQKTQGIDSVVVNGQTLTENVDYTVINNIYTNAGDYTLKVMGMGNYKGTAIASWSIAKATGSVSVSPTTLSIQGANKTDTATLTVIGDGAISVVSSDTNVATVERSGNTLTVTSVGDGTVNIIITLAASGNYIGDSATLVVSVVDVDSVLANNTPEQIQAAAQAGIASSLWSVGAVTAPISIGAVGNMSATSACAFIIGFDHNSSKEGTNRIHFQFGKTTSGTNIAFCDSGYNSNKSSGTWFNMNNSSTNSGGWNGSLMRTVICSAFKSALPSAWQNVIASTTKYTDNTGGSSNTASYVTVTTDDIFLLAEYEVFGSRSYANSAEQNYQLQYDYYKNGNAKIFHNHNTSITCHWWLRSPCAGRSDRFCLVNTSGSVYSASAYNLYGFAPGFSVA